MDDKKVAKQNNIILLGTSHISPQSIADIKKTIDKEKPDIIALELDKDRLTTLLANEKTKMHISDIFIIGPGGYLFGLIAGYVERKLGQVTGMKPGDEMKYALMLAKEQKRHVALVDQHISLTLKSLSKAIGPKEIWQTLKDIVTNIFKKDKTLPFDIRKVPDVSVIQKLLKEVQQKYPRIYDALITKRNKYMVRKLKAIQKNFPEKKILAIVGAGHVQGMKQLLKI